jgi:transposase InsO family protein
MPLALYSLCFIIIAFLSLVLFFTSRNKEALLENLILKTQLTAYKRKHKIFHTTHYYRIKLVLLSYLSTNWKSSLILVSPNTLIKWRNNKLKIFWKLISKRKKQGRPLVPWNLIKLIRRMAKENSIWGATKLHGLLLKLGFILSERTVSKYIPKRPPNPSDRLSWKKFYQLHADSLIVSDLLSTYSIDFTKIFRVVFFLDIKTRQILHWDIHTRPTTAWMRKAIKFALRKKGLKNTSYLLTDNDTLFGKRFSRYLEKMGITHKKTSVRSPWQNGYAERFVKTCKNEFLDYFIPLNEYHLKVKFEDFIYFYNHNRTHIAINKDTPISSTILHKPRDGDYKLVSHPVLGGLYHTYTWEKAA